VITASTALLLAQWEPATRLRAVIDIWLDELRTQDAAADRLQDMLRLETAEGAWLDRLGERVGLPRPFAVEPDASDTFGYDDAGQAFDQARFRDAFSEALEPIDDDLFRRCIRARIRRVTALPTIVTLTAACQDVDPTARLVDGHDKTVTVTVADERAKFDMEVARDFGALPLPALVSLTIQTR